MLSPLSTRKAEKLGYTDVKVFHAGMPAWKKGGNLVVSNLKNLAYLNKHDASYILLDVRSEEQIEKGHIPKAVAAPDGNLDDLKDQFPSYKKAAIILYNEDGDLASVRDTFGTIRGWGYKQTSVLLGGFDAWRQSGRKIAKGPAAAEINYVRKLLPGEITVTDFKALLEKPGGEHVIVDVRNPSEYEAGALPTALNVPLEELESKLDELPKDKTLLLHCSTGARAEMAHNVLKKAGFESKYLRAVVTVEKGKEDGYTITE